MNAACDWQIINLIKNSNENKTKYLLKVILFYWLNFLTLILFVTFAVLSFIHNPIWEPINQYQVMLGNYRFVFLWSIILFIFTCIWNTYNFLKWFIWSKKAWKWLILHFFTFSVFSFCDIYFIKSIIKKLTLKNNKWLKCFQKDFNELKSRIYIKKSFLITYDALFLILFLDIILLFLSPGLQLVVSSHRNIENSYLINVFSYFTQLTNIAFFVLMIFKRTLIKNRTWLVNISIYMIIVGIVFWIGSIPTLITNNSFVWTSWWNILDNIKSIFLHAINQVITIIIFIIFSKIQAINKLIIIDNKKTMVAFWNAMIYPIIYGNYLYTVPFLIPFSVYGFATNVNPNLVFQKQSGNLIYLLGIPIMLLTFSAFYFLINFINKKILINNNIQIISS